MLSTTGLRGTEMKLRRVKITASRTIQVQQYEPLTFTIEEEYEVPSTANSKEVLAAQNKRIRSLGSKLQKTIEQEADRYRD